MLRDLLYCSTLTDATKNAAVLTSARSLLTRYAVRALTSKEMLKKASLYPRRVKRAILSLKRKVLDCSEYFLTRLWRAYHTITRYFIKLGVACAKYNVMPAEIYLVYDILDAPDYHTVEKSKIRIDRMDKEDRREVFKAMAHHVKSLLNRRIGSPKFIANNDPGYSISDIKRELTEEGRRLFLYYEHFGNPAKVKNYVKRGMHNRCINFIKHSTAKCRRPISNIGDSNREFALTKVSIDSRVGEDETLSDVTKDSRMVRPDTLLEQKRLLTSLRKNLSPDLFRFVKIVVGNRLSQSFVRWMELRHGVAMEGSSDYYKLGELAMEYLGVSRSDVVRHVLPHLHVA